MAKAAPVVGDRARSGPAPRARAGWTRCCSGRTSGISLLVLVLPRVLRPLAREALLATLVGGGDREPAARGRGDDRRATGRVPAMVLQRAPLGHRGSYLATVLNVLQCFGWAIFELIVIAKAAGAALATSCSGSRRRWLWTLLFGALTMVLALLGPIGFVRRYVRRLAIWAVAASLAYLTWWILDGAGATTSGRRQGPAAARSGPRSTS